MAEQDETEEEFWDRFEQMRQQMPPGTEPKTMQRKTSDPKRLASYQAQASMYATIHRFK